MFKKIVSVVAAMSLVVVIFSSFGFKKNEYKASDANDLAKDAAITASEDKEKISALNDDSGSAWTASAQGASVEIDFKKEVLFNTVTFKEKTDNVKNFSIHFWDGTEYQLLYTQDRIDKYRMCVVENTKTSKIRIVFDEFHKKVKISQIQVLYQGDYKRSDFKVTSYLNSPMDEKTGKTLIQSQQNDEGYTKRFSVLTDVIIIGQVIMNQDGTISVTTGIENFKTDVEILKKINPDMKVRCTIMTGLVNNDFKGNNKAMVKFSKNTLEEYKKNLKAFVEETGVDGVDYDWEYPQLPHEWNAYNKLLIASKEALNGRELSVALWPYGVMLSKEARACIDNVNIMAYDQFDERGDHSSTYEMGQKTINYFLKHGFSKEQLCFGIPFYGRTADGYGIWPSYDEKYGKWSNYREDFEYQDADGVKQKSTVFLNGYAMVRDKTALALHNDLGGIMIFSSTADISYDNEYALHRAVEEVLAQRVSE